MSKADLLIEFGMYVVPAIALFASVYYFTNKWVEVQTEKHKLSVINQPEPQHGLSEIKRHFFPLQVDAYQRLVLLLERIAPNNIVMRMNNPALPAGAFQQQLLETIRNEFEHNLAQQIFVSQEVWAHVRNSKEEVLKIINMAATKIGPDAMATDLSRSILEITSQIEVQPTDRAVALLKAELNSQLV